MNRKLTISLSVFLSFLLIGTVGINVSFASGTAPTWHPVNSDISEWDLRWEGELNSSYNNLSFALLINSSGVVENAWGQIWTKNNTSPGLDAAALVWLVDLDKAY